MKISGFNNAVLLLDKPAGKTSSELVSMVRRITGIKKVGHSGTLDRFATGLMVLCTGKATRLTRFFLADDKRYTGRIKLGIETDTCDITGEVLHKRPFSSINADMIEDAVTRFRGEIDQLPPKYSALKIDGKRASDRVRSGEEIELARRRVEIYSFEVKGFYPEEGCIDFEVFCSKGTYVRALARDIGEVLGTGGCLDSLRRISSGGFDVKDAVTVEELEEAAVTGTYGGVPFLIDPADVLKHFGRAVLNEKGVARALNGAPFEREDAVLSEGRGSEYLLLTGGDENLIAIAGIDIDKWQINYRCVFN